MVAFDVTCISCDGGEYPMKESKPLSVPRRIKLTLNIKHNLKHPQHEGDTSRGENPGESGLSRAVWLSLREKIQLEDCVCLMRFGGLFRVLLKSKLKEYVNYCTWKGEPA